MTKRVQLVRHDNAGAAIFLGKLGEITINTGNKSVHVHDAINQGGTEQARADLENVAVVTANNAGKVSTTMYADHLNTVARSLANESGVAANLAAIVANDAEILTLQGETGSLQTQVTTNTGDIASLQTDKADKIIPVTVANIATLDAAGNLTDGGSTVAEVKARANHTGTQLLSTISDSGALAALNSVSQSELDASAVGQSEIKSTYQQVSHTAAASTVTHTYFVASGGGFCMGHTMHASTPGGTRQQDLYRRDNALTTSPSAAWDLVTIESSGAPFTSYVRLYYVQASPPYDLGDGEIPLFIFGLVDNATGKIESLSVSPEAPWHYNGKTNIQANRKDKVSGRSWRNCCRTQLEKFENQVDVKTLLMNPATRQQGLDILADKKPYEIEITQAVKQADMPDIPHTFGGDLTGKTVVLLDPVSPIIEQLFHLYETGEDVNELIHDGYLTYGNSQIARVTPKGVVCVDLAWKNTK